jgi:hypothetical protein
MLSLFAYKLFDNCVEFGASKFKTNWFGVETPPMASLFACILFDNRVTFGAFNCVKFEASNLKINWN